MKPFLRMVILVAVTWGAAGCDTKMPAQQSDAVTSSCTYGGATRTLNETFSSDDGCNTCTCLAAGVACTTRACTDGGGGTAVGGAAGTGTGGGAGTGTGGGAGGATASCTPGNDVSCNEDRSAKTARGTCGADGTCSCGTNLKSGYTGKCLALGATTDLICEADGASHPVRTQWTCADGCNTCMCTGPGQILATAALCSCPFIDIYTYGDVGEPGLPQSQTTLGPPSMYTRTRTGTAGGTVTCAPPLPACATPGLLDSRDIMDDIFAYIQFGPSGGPNLFGRDARAYDGTVFSFTNARGAGFVVGDPCLPESPPSCQDAPAVVKRLVADLRALDQQQLADPTCAALR